MDQTVARLLAEIRSGALKPGQRLGEGMLARRLGVGRAPVKMALDQLAFAGVVERRPRSGSYVGQWSPEDYLQLLHLRAALESMACRLAAGRLTAEQQTELRQLAQRLDRLSRPQTPAVLTEAEAAFHTAIARASGNRWLLRALLDQRVVVDCVAAWMRRPVARPATGPNVTHEQLVDILAAGDGELAARAMLTHILVAVQEITSAP